MSQSSLIDLKEIVASYGRETKVGPFSFALDKSEFVALIGPNGSGKSTMIKAILGLVPIVSGRIQWNPQKVPVAYIPQRARLNPQVPCTVREFLEIQGDGAVAASALDWMSEIGLGREIFEKSVHSLSGGTLQRLLLTMAIRGPAKIIILDEGLEGLDPAAQEQAFRGLDERVKAGALVILVSHDITAVTSRATRVICISQSVDFDGNPNSPEFHACLHRIYGEGSHIHDHAHHHQHNHRHGHGSGEGGPHE